MAFRGSSVGRSVADRADTHATPGTAIGNADTALAQARHGLSVWEHDTYWTERPPLASRRRRQPPTRATRPAEGADRVCEQNDDDCSAQTATDRPGACGLGILPRDGIDRAGPALTPPNVSIDEMLETLREFDRFGGASLSLMAWEFSVEPRCIAGA